MDTLARLQHTWRTILRAQYSDSLPIREAASFANSTNIKFGSAAWYAAAIWHYNNQEA